MKRCGLCGHVMTLESCGAASSADGVPLCHHDTHSCYHRWTAYTERAAAECSGACVTGADVGVDEYASAIVHAHPDCPLHGGRDECEINTTERT